MAILLVPVGAGSNTAFADILVLDVADDGPHPLALLGVAAFESPRGLDYLLTVNSAGVAQTVNVTDPRNPSLLGDVHLGITYDPAMRDGMDVGMFRVNDQIYAVVVWGGQPSILNVTDPTRPILVGPTNRDSDPTIPDAILLVGVIERPDGRIHMLMMDAENRLYVVNVTDPSDPVPLADPHKLSGAPLLHADLYTTNDGGSYLVGTDSTVRIVDVTDPLRPVPAGTIRHAPESWRTLGDTVSGQYASYEAEWRIDTLAAGTVTTFESQDGRTYAAVAGSPAFVSADGSVDFVMAGGIWMTYAEDSRYVPAGILLLDITDPYDLVPAGSLHGGEAAMGYIQTLAAIESPDGRMYVVAAGEDAMVVDVTDPYSPVHVKSLRDGEEGFDAVDYVMGMAAFSVSDEDYLALVGLEGIQIVDDGFAAAGSLTSDQNPAPFLGDYDHVVFEPGDGRIYVAVVHGDGVHIADVTGPHLPVPAGGAYDGRGGFDALDEPRLAATFQTAGHTYVGVVGEEGVQIINVSNPDSPTPAGSLRSGEDGFDVRYPIITGMDILRHPSGDYILVGDHDRGIHMVDVSDPLSPVYAGMWSGPDTWGGVHDIGVFEAADGRMHVLVVQDRGVHIMDMANPYAPMEAGALGGRLGGLTPAILHQVEVFELPGGGVGVLLADYQTGLHVVNASDPTFPAYLGNVPADDVGLIPGSHVAIVKSPDGRLYALATGVDGVGVADITDPQAPVPMESLDMNPLRISILERPDGGIHALMGSSRNVAVLDATYPHAPAPVGEAAVHPGPRRAVVFESEGSIRALVTADDGAAKVVDLTDPGAPRILGTIPPDSRGRGDALAVASPDGRTYGVWAGQNVGDALTVADITGSDPGPPIHRNLGPVPGPAAALFKGPDGRSYMMAGGGDAITLLDVTYPTDPVPVGRTVDNLGGFYALGDVRDIAAFESPDGLAYALAGGGDGVQVIDVTNPYAPTPAGALHAPAVGGVAAVRTSDEVLALASYATGRVDILDVTNPYNLVRAGTIPGDGHESEPGVSAFVASDGRAYALLTGAGGSQIIDMSNPASPAQVALLDGAAQGSAVFESPGGSLHALLTGEWGVRTIYVDDPVRYYMTRE